MSNLQTLAQNHTRKGVHYLLDLHGCFPYELDSASEWNRIFGVLQTRFGLEVLDKQIVQFEPHGLTGFLLLGTSHISFHTWPENKYIALDIFTCGDRKQAEAIVSFLLTEFKHDAVSSTVQRVDRGFYHPSKKVKKDQNEFIFNKISDKGQLVQVKQDHSLGMCLVLDRVVQSSTLDSHIYDSSVLMDFSSELIRRDIKNGDIRNAPHTVATEPEDCAPLRLLILGGGDLNVAIHARKLNPTAQIVMVEYDEDVLHAATYLHTDQELETIGLTKQDILKFVKMCKESAHGGHMHFSIRGFTIVNNDVYKWLESLIGDNFKYDFIVSDITEMPIGCTANTRAEFYRTVYSTCARHLKVGGTISLDTGSLDAENDERRFALIDAMEGSKLEVKMFDRTIPSFSETVRFLSAKKVN